MYKIIGQDGKEYGPITAEQLRQWISENRVEQPDAGFHGRREGLDFRRPAAGIRRLFPPRRKFRRRLRRQTGRFNRRANREDKFLCSRRTGLRHFVRDAVFVLRRNSVQRARPDFFHRRAGADQRKPAASRRSRPRHRRDYFVRRQLSHFAWSRWRQATRTSTSTTGNSEPKPCAPRHKPFRRK